MLAVEAFEEVTDSLCVPQYNKDGEERVLLFLKMASGHTFGPDLVNSIRSAIRHGLSARHVPSLILETKGIPVGAPLGSCPPSPAAPTPVPPTLGGSPAQLGPALYRLCALPGNAIFPFSPVSLFF